MSGFHNKRIYTFNDNPWCMRCLNGERVVGEKLLQRGATVCLCGGIPTKVECKKFVERNVNKPILILRLI